MGFVTGWLWKALAGALAVVSAIAYMAHRGKEKAQKRATEATQKAKQERDARKAVQRTVEVTSEVEDAVNRIPPEQRRDRLRKWATGSRD